MNKHTHTTHHTPTTSTPTTLVITGVGRPFVWKYRLGADSYERQSPSVGGGWWSEIEPRDARRGTMCPTHNVQRTPSGHCDECD